MKSPSTRALWVALSLVASAGCHPTASPTARDAATRPRTDAGADFASVRAAALRAIEAHDDATALRLATQACDGGYLLGCKTLGWLHESGRGTPADPARARVLYRRACEGGEVSGCKSLGLLWDTGAGGAVDRARAAALYERACNGGEIDACNNLANLCMGGDGVPRDIPRAITLYDRACAGGGSPRACENARSLRAERDASVDR